MRRLLTLWTGILLAGSTLFARAPQERVLPAIDGWDLSIDETVYTPDNLWDVIDGAADLFLEYNFVDLHIGRYTKPSGFEIKVELYRHGSADDAFGIYSQERYPDYHFIDLGVQGYSEKGILNFLTGAYYLKISTLQSGAEAREGMNAIGTAIERILRQPKTWPVLVSVFPAEGKQENSEQYVAKNFLGYSFFHSAFTAAFGTEGALRAFVMRLESDESAKRMVDAYGTSLPEGAISELQEDEFRVKDPHNGPIYLGVRGNTVFGVTGEGSGQAMKQLFESLKRNLGTNR